MELPLIQALDLRDREIAHEIDNYGVYWDWPHFPVDTLTFINTGIRPNVSRKVTVTFMVNVKPFRKRLAHIARLLEIAGQTHEGVSPRGW